MASLKSLLPYPGMSARSRFSDNSRSRRKFFASSLIGNSFRLFIHTSWYPRQAYDSESYESESSDLEAYDSESYDSESCDLEAYESESYDAESYESESYELEAYESESYDSECNPVLR